MTLTAGFLMIFWLSLLLVIYVYVGYPILLYLFVREPKRRRQSVNSEGRELRVTLIISAYNEERVIREKIINSLGLDYPKDKFEIVVVSDCSTDHTDAIVESFKGQGVILLRLQQRGGKTEGLNQAVAKANGDVIVFSDANAMYEPQTLRKLVRHFSAPSVGYVVGEQRYVDDDSSAASNEGLYWKYEQFLKRKESQLSSVVGGDGALYAIRKSLYEPLKETDISDFVNPLQIIEKGYKGVYEPGAICWEHAAGTYGGEFKRKTRIVNRSLRGLWRVRRVLNPFKYGFFTWQLVSHKLIRWFAPFLMIATFFSNLALVILNGFELRSFYTMFLGIQLLGYALAALGHFLIQPILSIPYYFCLVNLASMVGVWKALRGETIVTWEPEREEQQSEKRDGANRAKAASK
jgi:cellulose synthase/poly-beta-1,6-N-acetylglucosamine synthase-like glycosyltransferase